MLIAQQVATQLIRSLSSLLEQIRVRDAALADQGRRAASSALLNIAEGNRRIGKDRPHLFRVAAGSAAEVDAVLVTAAAWGYVDEVATEEVRRRIDRLLGLLWGLTHRRA